MVMLSNLNYSQELDVQTCVEMFLAKYRDKSKQTFKTYYNGLQMMANSVFNKDVYDLSKEDIMFLTWKNLENYKYTLSINNKNSTVNSRISTIKKFIEFTVSRLEMNYDISQLRLVENLSDDRDYTDMIPEELLMKYSQWFEDAEMHSGKEKKWATLLLFETGIRADAILSATKRDFKKEDDLYVLTVKDKGRKEFKRLIGEEIYNELISLNPNSEDIFSINYDNLLNAFKRANEHFDNKYNYTPHSIRKLAITNHYKITGCIVSTQKFAGHSSLTSTQRYLDIKEELIEGAYTRRISTKDDMYKQLELSELISIIDTMPIEFKKLLNEKVKYVK